VNSDNLNRSAGQIFDNDKNSVNWEIKFIKLMKVGYYGVPVKNFC